MKKPENLTDKQWAFVLRYPLDFNGTQSYMDIYGEKDENVAASSASRLLRNAKIKTVLKSVYEEMAMPVEEMFVRLRKEATVNSEAGDRLRALGMIGKGHAAFVDKVEQDTTLNINVNFGEDDE